jgi:tripartite ATP-independent transporter DctM subunit
VLIFGLFVVFTILGAPIAFAIGASGAIGLYFSPGGSDLLPIVPQQMFNSLSSFTLLTIPLFIFTGTLMARGGVAHRLMDFAEVTVGRGRGGLGAAIVVSTMFFHGISGSSTADTAAIGRVTLPSLRDQGYPIPFSTALLAASGATATLIPPTVDLIIIGVVANISIAGLFAGGIIPAIINGTGLVLTVLYLSHRRGYGRVAGRQRFLQLVRAFLIATPALFMIVILLGGILSGVFTPTEASAVAVTYGLFISMFVYRDLKVKMLPEVVKNSIELTGVVMLVIAMSSVLSYAMTVNQVPTQLAIELQQVAHNRVVFLLLVQALFFVIGMFMDGVPALIVLMPILTPIAVAHGVAPIHFGILVEANVALGLAMPPVGLCLYAACAVTQLPLERVIKPLLPFIGILLVTLLVITYVEGFSMFLPRLLGLTR